MAEQTTTLGDHPDIRSEGADYGSAGYGQRDSDPAREKTAIDRIDPGRDRNRTSGGV